MKNFYNDYVIEINHSYNKDKNLLLFVFRVHNTANNYDERYKIIDLNTMKEIEVDIELIRTTYWKDINFEEICDME